jgi:hypothetical protein
MPIGFKCESNPLLTCKKQINNLFINLIKCKLTLNKMWTYCETLLQDILGLESLSNRHSVFEIGSLVHYWMLLFYYNAVHPLENV